VDFNGRLERLSQELAERNLDCLLVGAAPNIFYLSGFSGSAGVVLVRAAGRPGNHLFLSDFRYRTQAAGEVAPAFEQAFVSAGEAGRELSDLLCERLGEPPGRLAFEADQLTVAALSRLERKLPRGWELEGVEGVLSGLRERKEPEEVERIAQASALADQALHRVLEGGLVGRTERELAVELDYRMRQLGAEGESFPAIVASGPHGALPHAKARAEAIASGTLVTIDWGAKLDGYCSDCTRTYGAGTVGADAKEVHRVVLEAQQQALDRVGAGVLPSALDTAARELIDRAGYGELFGHALGHGVGIEVHEAPRLGPPRPDQAERPLQPGAVVTVEPGIYIPGRLGVRIEELVVVGEGSSTVLTSLPRELLEL